MLNLNNTNLRWIKNDSQTDNDVMVKKKVFIFLLIYKYYLMYIYFFNRFIELYRTT